MERAAREDRERAHRVADAWMQARVPSRHRDNLRADMEWPDNAHGRAWDAIERGGLVGLVGRFGTGKSQLAAWLIARYVQAFAKSALYVVWHDAMTDLRKSWDDEATDPRKRLRSVGLLVLDELQVQQGTQTDRTEFHALLDARYREERPTVLIANMKAADVYADDGLIGPRIVSRMREGGALIELRGSDRRTAPASGAGREA